MTLSDTILLSVVLLLTYILHCEYKLRRAKKQASLALAESSKYFPIDLASRPDVTAYMRKHDIQSVDELMPFLQARSQECTKQMNIARQMYDDAVKPWKL